MAPSTRIIVPLSLYPSLLITVPATKDGPGYFVNRIYLFGLIGF